MDITARPDGVLLAAEWAPEVYFAGADRYRLDYGGRIFSILDVDIRPASDSPTGPFQFKFVSEAWSVAYEADYADERMVFNCVDAHEIIVEHGTSAEPLSQWLTTKGLILSLEGDQLIDQAGRLFKPDSTLLPYDRQSLRTIDWRNIDIHKESQGPGRDADSIQSRCVAQLKLDEDWDVILDDDGPGEVADLVALKLTTSELYVKVVHCKYSHQDTPGARVQDLYEVCGQANKSVRWRRGDIEGLFKYLDRRARSKQQRTGVTPFDVGNESVFYQIREQAAVRKVRFEIVIAQPGLSAEGASSQQLDLLASTEGYLLTTIATRLQVWCSE